MIVQSVHHNHSIECTLFFPWYSWWLYKVYITIIVIRERTRYIRYYDCDVHFVQSSTISGKEQGTFDTMIVMSTLYSHQLYQGKNKVLIQLMIVQSGHHNHSIECTLFFPWYSWWMYKVYIIIIVSNVPCSFPDIADDCTIRERTRYIRYYDCDVHFVHSSAVSGKEQGTFDTMIVMSLFFPWYSWWLYKVYITIIVSNVPCSFPDIADDCTKCTSQS
jgi:hypothetical protein